MADEPARVDVSAYTDEDGIVHVKVIEGDRVFELQGQPLVTIEASRPPMAMLRQPCEPFLWPTRYRFTLEVAEAKELMVRMLPASAVEGGEAGD